jgi:xanthine dehydrogenase accessory factor
MREIEKIIETRKQWLQEGKKLALATVLRVNGSAYRRAGARMIISNDGHWAGAISGGCLEGDALRKAREVISSGTSRMVRYDTVNEESAKKLGIGLGCEGIIDIVIEPDGDTLNKFFENLEMALKDEQEFVIGHFVSFQENHSETGPKLNRFFYSNDRDKTSQSISPGFLDVLKTALQNQKAIFINPEIDWANSLNRAQHSVFAFVEYIPKPISLFIFGAGFDAIPVAELAAKLGWKVVINDDCAAHLIPKRFSCAHSMVCGSPDVLVERHSFHSRSAALLISHNFEFDKKVLKSILPTDVPYIGILGPAKRAQKLYAELECEGFIINDQMLKRIYAPVGLHLGAETPAEIGVSIISEMMAFFNSASAKGLKYKEGSIHQEESMVQ